MQKFILLFATFFAGIGCSQTLVITDVITSGPRDHMFAPGTTVYILGTFPSPAAGRDFSITVGGQTGGINVADTSGFITAPIPINTPAGPTTLTVTWQGQTSNGFPVTIQSLAPEIDGAGVLVGGTPQPNYEPYDPFQDANTGQRITPSAPASTREPLSMAVYGLGQNIALTATPSVTVSGITAQIATVQSGTGRETIIFFVPPTAPNGIDPVVVTVAGANSNTVGLPVGTSPAVGSVLNAASFGSSGAVAPGSIVSVFGANFGAQDNLSAFPSTSVNGLSVMFGSTAAPIFASAAKEGQINVLVPTELATSGSVNLSVQSAAGTSAVFPLNLVPAAPAAFYYGDPYVTTRRNAVAVVANTAWIAMPVSLAASLGLPSNCASLAKATLCGEPAHAGDYLQIYATGLGKATPNGDPAEAVLPTGQVAPASGSPLYETVATPTVMIGGLPAMVIFSGVGPGYAGLYQLDVQIPAGVSPGNDVPLAISVGSSATDTTTIAIQ
jgi:uncharacterized protein (TIGR03437 family)